MRNGTGGVQTRHVCTPAGSLVLHSTGSGIHTLLHQALSTGSHIRCILLRVNAGLYASARHAGIAINAHLQQVMPPLLSLASSESTAPGPVAAREAMNKIVAAVAEDGLYLLIAQVAAILR